MQATRSPAYHNPVLGVPQVLLFAYFGRAYQVSSPAACESSGGRRRGRILGVTREDIGASIQVQSPPLTGGRDERGKTSKHGRGSEWRSSVSFVCLALYQEYSYKRPYKNVVGIPACGTIFAINMPEPSQEHTLICMFTSTGFGTRQNSKAVAAEVTTWSTEATAERVSPVRG